MPRSRQPRRYDRVRAVLADARRAANLTQRELAGRLGRPQSFVAKYEGGERRIDVVEFAEICEAIGIDPNATLSEIIRSPAVRLSRGRE